MARLVDRSATDLVVLAIVVIIGFILIFGAVGIVLIELIHPETDTDPLLRVESEILGVLVGALVGFIGGRATGRSESDRRPPI